MAKKKFVNIFERFRSSRLNLWASLFRSISASFSLASIMTNEIEVHTVQPNFDILLHPGRSESDLFAGRGLFFLIRIGMPLVLD